MGFVFYDLTFLIVSSLIIGLILVINRKKIKREGILLLYRTKLGVKFIEYISDRHKKFLNKFEIVVIIFGYLLMALGIWSFAQFIYTFLSNPEFVKLIKIPPIAPLIPYLPQLFKADYLPFFYFTYWIVVLAIVAVVHEFFHGIFAKARDIKIKSTGFYFLGPFFGAFVEPDEKKVAKLEKKPQIAFLSAGSFSNLMLAIFFLFIFWIYFYSAYTPSGIVFQDYSKSVLNSSLAIPANQTIYVDSNLNLNLTRIEYNNKSYYIDEKAVSQLKDYGLIYAYDDTPALKSGLIGAIIEADGKKIRNNEDLQEILKSKKPDDLISIKTDYKNEIKEYNLILTSHPADNSRAFLGITQLDLKAINAKSSFFAKIRNKIIFFKNPNIYYKPKIFEDFTIFIYHLLWWIIIVNLGVAMFNMLPLGIADGGRVWYLSVLGITKSEKIAKFAYKATTWLIIAAFIAITIFWFFNFR